jgi:ATP-dependent Clp protease ATP-binding subunit ClpA
MFERFTQGARAVVTQAQEEARALGHDWIGCEHLLIAAAAMPDQPAERALRAAGLTPERLRTAVVEALGAPAGPDPAALAAIGIDLAEVRRRVEEAFGPGALERRRPARTGRMPFTPRSKRALEWAVKAARARGDGYIGPEHVLLGVLDQEESMAACVLARLGVPPERVREQLEVRSA